MLPGRLERRGVRNGHEAPRPYRLLGDRRRPRAARIARREAGSGLDHRERRELGHRAAHAAHGCCLRRVTDRTFRTSPTGSWQEYGMRVGFWRILDALSSRGIPVTMSVNGSVCVQYPRIAAAAKDAGWEFSGPRLLAAPRPPDRGRARGHPPDGRGDSGVHRQPAPRLDGTGSDGDVRKHPTTSPRRASSTSRTTRWDDEPFEIRTEHGPLVSIPYSIEYNDIPMMLVQHHKAAEFHDRCMDGFERLDREGAREREGHGDCRAPPTFPVRHFASSTSRGCWMRYRTRTVPSCGPVAESWTGIGRCAEHRHRRVRRTRRRRRTPGDAREPAPENRR